MSAPRPTVAAPQPARARPDLAAIWAEYWAEVLPRAAVRLKRWERRASTIPDRGLREQALHALRVKRWNALGVSMFATASGTARLRVLHHLLALQTIYDYVDLISETEAGTPAEDTMRLHSALVDAVDPDRTPSDYYASRRRSDDGGYLAGLVADARRPVAALPGHAAARPDLTRLASEIATVQGLKHQTRQTRLQSVRQWAGGDDREWIEAAAASCSPITLHACAALAARPAGDTSELARTEDALRPAAALDALLDSFVDGSRDRMDDELNWAGLLGGLAEESMLRLVDRALEGTRHLTEAALHRCVVHSMIGFYLSAPEARAPERAATTARLLARAGRAAQLAQEILTVRSDAEHVTRAALAIVPRLRTLDRPPAERC